MKKSNLHFATSSILRGSLFVLNILTLSFLTKFSTVQNVGNFYFLISLITLLMVFFSTGQTRYIVRSLSLNHFKNSAKALIFQVSRSPLIISITTFALVLIFTVNFNKSEVLNAIFLLAVPVLILSNNFSAFFRGIGRPFYGNLDGMLIRPAIFLFILAFTYFHLGISLSLSIIIFSYLISIIFGFICNGIAYLYFSKNLDSNIEKELISRKEILYLSIIGSSELILSNIDQFLIGFFFNNENVAYIRVMSTFRNSSLMAYQIILMFIPFIFGAFIAKNDIESFVKEFRKFRKISTFVNTSIVVVFYFFGSQFLEILFTKDFIVLYEPILILLFGTLIFNTAGPVQEALIALRKDNILIVANIFLVIIYALTSVLGFQYFSFYGVAVSYSCCIAFYSLFLYLFFGDQIKKLRKIDA